MNTTTHSYHCLRDKVVSLAIQNRKPNRKEAERTVLRMIDMIDEKSNGDVDIVLANQLARVFAYFVERAPKRPKKLWHLLCSVCGKKDIRPTLHNIWFDGKRFYATNGHILLQVDKDHIDAPHQINQKGWYSSSTFLRLPDKEQDNIGFPPKYRSVVETGDIRLPVRQFDEVDDLPVLQVADSYRCHVLHTDICGAPIPVQRQYLLTAKQIIDIVGIDFEMSAGFYDPSQYSEHKTIPEYGTVDIKSDSVHISFMPVRMITTEYERLIQRD